MNTPCPHRSHPHVTDPLIPNLAVQKLRKPLLTTSLRSEHRLTGFISASESQTLQQRAERQCREVTQRHHGYQAGREQYSEGERVGGESS